MPFSYRCIMGGYPGSDSESVLSYGFIDNLSYNVKCFGQ